MKNWYELNNSTDNLTDKWDLLVEMGVSEETLDIITSINGYNLQTLEDVLYAKFGYRSFEQLERESYN